MSSIPSKISSYLISIIILSILLGCSKDNNEDIRTPDDIIGVWSPSSDIYLEFCEDNTIRNLQIVEQDSESIGEWNDEVYFYEPGYDLLIYLTYNNKAIVYKIISLTDQNMTICWVEDIKQSMVDELGIGNVIGQIINQAQEGFKIDPELYQSFHRIPKNQFLEMLEELDIMYPWGLF